MADLIILALDRDALIAVPGLLVARGELGVEIVVDIVVQHLVLRALGAGKARLDARHIERERIGEYRIGRGRVAP